MSEDAVVGIRAAAAYAPRLRIETETVADALGGGTPSGVETTAVPEADEDALTMGVAAARRTIEVASAEADDHEEVVTSLGGLAFATSTPPLDEEDLTARLGSALAVPAAVPRQQFLGSTRAGTGAIRAVSSSLPALVVAADAPRGEPTDDREAAAGAGAAAVLLDDPEECPAVVRSSAAYATPYPGTRFRERGSDRIDGLDVTSYDRSAFRETVAGAVEGLDTPPGTDVSHVGEFVDAAAIQSPDGALPYRIADGIGVDTDAIARCAHVDDLGDTGAASAPLSLVIALEDGADRILCVGYGSGGGADALLVTRSDPVPATLALEGGDGVERTTLSYAEYLRRRGDITSGPPDGGGAYVSVPTWRRSIPQRHRLVAGRCRDCGALAYPPRGACADCNSLDGYDRVGLPGTGTVETVTTIAQGGAPPEFAEQQTRSGDFPVAIVAFDGPEGATASAPVQVTDVDPDEVAVGDRVRATFRRIYTQEGVTRYGPKVRPASE